ncbi:MAG: hypothetical protein R3321_14925, partial [Nitrososphaeraceae archaeon]|nr:hypothetical protein [Nitrososphaeraceae archaeon]
DSAHLYGLAIDGNLINKNTGEIINESTGRVIWEDYFNQYWDGYTEFSPGTSNKRWHIHLNINREINAYTKWAGLAAAAITGAVFVKKFIYTKKG